MPADLQAQFGTYEGERSYGAAVADLLRAERHDLAEQKLAADLATLRVPLAELCLATPADGIELVGWEALQHTVFRPARSGGPCTAVALNLSNYADRPRTPEGWFEPTVEAPFYLDDVFPFSTSSREEILAACAEDPTPWVGGGEELGPFYGLLVVGMARLNTAICDHSPKGHPLQAARAGSPPVPAPADYIAFVLAELFLALRHHQTVRRYLEREGLARRIPVIVGSHGMAPFVKAVYYPEPSRESAAGATARMLAAQEEERRELRDERRRWLEDRASIMRTARELIRKERVPFWPSRATLLLRSRYEEVERTVIARTHPSGPFPGPGWRIADDAEYDRFLRRHYVEPFLDDREHDRFLVHYSDPLFG